MIYLLAVIDDPRRAMGALATVTEDDTTVVSCGRVACVGLRWSGSPPEPDAAALRRHDAMVQALVRVCTVVPFRFATLVGGAAEVESWMGHRMADLQPLLGQLRGRVEMGVRASVAGRSAGAERQDQPAVQTGRAYLRMLERDRSLNRALAGIHQVLSARSEKAVVSVGDNRRMAASYLVDAERVHDFRAHADQLRSESRDVSSLSVTGPWAPYSFVGGAPTLDLRCGCRGRGDA